MIKSLLGNLSLVCVFLTCISTVYFSFWTHKKEYYNYYLLLILTNLQFVFGLCALLCLGYGYINSDFTILNVYNNSSTIKPLIFKIAALWGNHEGSILLWSFLQITSTLIFAISSSAPINFKSVTLLIQSLINACFTGFIIFTSNPFIINPESVSEGIGFNPLLQDYTLIIHPPILYIAYSAAAIIFSITVAGCLTKHQTKLLAYISRKWAVFTFITLTIGITLGSWWAYRELGWGGYWFWDPVENSSLLPWLISLALIHATKITMQNNKFSTWYLCFALSLFCSSIIATLIVRSGVISSVHSFANDGTRGMYILYFVAGIILLSIVLIASRLRSKAKDSNQHIRKNLLNQETGFLLLFSLVVTLFLTILTTLIVPLLMEIFLKHKITIGEPYFNQTFVPIAIFGLCCAAIFTVLPLYKAKKLNYKNCSIAVIITIILLSFLKYRYDIITSKHLIYLFVSLFLINFSIFIIFAKNNYKNLAMIGSHIGIAVMAIGMTLSGVLSEELTKKLVVGEKFTFANYTIKLNQIKLDKKDNYLAIRADLYTEKSKNEIGILAPEIRFFLVENSTTTESAVYSSIFEDLYITIHEVIDQQNIIIKVQLKPFMSFIWGGSIMVACFSLIALFRKIAR